MRGGSKFWVNCRIGSLEKKDDGGLGHVEVNCRIGSLENSYLCPVRQFNVNCRIGSLEKKQENLFLTVKR